MQEPTSEEGAILKREWWMKYDADDIPPLYHVIQSYDTAFLKKETADYSAITTWGLWYPEEDGPPQLLLLDAIKGRYEFPELKKNGFRAIFLLETGDSYSRIKGIRFTFDVRVKANGYTSC